ncbi:MAG: glycoside hydrolase [Acidobacteriaceae bacterium]|nr:glycoside hydrolase [Acidobacteriaceae bacterium]
MHVSTALAGLAFAATSTLGYAQMGTPQGNASQTSSIAALRAGFKTPPQQARLRCYWWWLNGNTDKATITHDLTEMKAKGFGGALLVDAGGATQNGHAPVPAGPRFGSAAWVALYTHALREADRLGLEITLNIMSGWNLGGPTVRPEDASKALTFATTVVKGGSAQEVDVPQPQHTQGMFYRQIAVLAYPLHHGQAKATQLEDGQGDRHTAAEQHVADGYSSSIRFRAAAAESGFSMNDSSAMLNDGLDTTFRDEDRYADASLAEVRRLQPAADGKLHLDLPAGEWEIFTVGYTNTGAQVSTSSDTWKGLAIDHMSRSAFQHYWEANVDPLLVAAKPFHSLKYLATDSWELGGTNWTDGFDKEFRQHRGYDPIPYLPVLTGRILGDRSVTTRFLTDLRRTVADLIVANHYDVFAQMAGQHGLGVQAESGGPHGAPIDALETFRHAAIPQTEFWSQNPHRHEDQERFFTKQAASAANIYGQHYVAQEGETSIGPQWSESLATDLKPSFDMAITEGMNRLVWHEFTSSPAESGVPGQEYFAGTHLNPKVTWWTDGGPFFSYLNRVQFLMQQGTTVNDVLYFYGDHIPNFVRLKADDPAHVLPGYDYDVTNEDALLRTIHIAGHELVGPSGVHWRALVLPRTRRISLAALQMVERYLRAGGIVISLPPVSSTGNLSNVQKKRLDELIAQIWKGCPEGESHLYGAGTVFCTDNAHEALQRMRVPADVTITTGDVRLAPVSTDSVDAIHRQVAGTQIYYLRSSYATEKSFTIALRATGDAEIWDPVTGSAHRARTAAMPDGRSRVSVTLPAYGSAAIVFLQHSASGDLPQLVHTEPVKADWSLAIPGRESVHLTELKSWTEIDSTKYFSGTGVYSTSLTTPKLSAGETSCLRFEGVHEIARVTFAGKPVATTWAAPYEVCLRGPLPESGILEVAVTNLWHNRRVGDSVDPSARQTKSNIALPSPDEPLLPSGLTGGVEWRIYRGRP